MSSPLRVGFAGIGNMGWPMARNILTAGFALTVYDVDFKRAQRFAAEVGGAAADTATALGRASDLLVTMLPTGAEVAKVVLGVGGDGALAGLEAGAIVVDMSSSDPVGTRELGAFALLSHPAHFLQIQQESMKSRNAL